MNSDNIKGKLKDLGGKAQAGSASGGQEQHDGWQASQQRGRLGHPAVSDARKRRQPGPYVGRRRLNPHHGPGGRPLKE